MHQNGRFSKLRNFNHVLETLYYWGIAKVLSNDPQATMTKVPGTVDFMPSEYFQGQTQLWFTIKCVLLWRSHPIYHHSTMAYTAIPTPSWAKIDSGKTDYLSGSQRRQHHLDNTTGGATNLKPLVISA